MGTVIMLRLAISTPFRIASGTSRALPSPAPTRPFMSPTTISAEKEKRRPPFSTLATRFRLTTRSVTSLRSPYDGYLLAIGLELQTRLAGGVREGLDAAVIEEAAPVEHGRSHARRLRTLRDRPADGGCGGHVLAARLQLRRGRRCQRPAGSVVDQLRVQVVQAAVDAEPRPLGRAGDLDPHPAVPPPPRGLAIELLE